jgi:glycosyltransferase involved in cell wall biosynthesis
LAVGSLIEVKGHAELISAFAMQQRKDLILAIAGSGPLAEQLRRQADELGVGGRVRLLGFCDDVNALIDASDLVVHPSHSEGLSLVLIQAKMLAKPIVATKVGGAREVLETGPSVQTGFWPAQPKDVSSLSESICAALATLDHPPAGFLENLRDAQQSTLQRFDIRVSAAKLAQLVHSLLPASP